MLLCTGAFRLVFKESVARDTLKLRFDISNLTDLQGNQIPENHFDFLPGQFVSLRFGEKSWRAYSIASTPEDPLIELVVRLVEGGVASTVFDQSQIGDTFEFKGPFGHFTLSDDNIEQIFCSTGTGIAPMRGMILEEARKSSPRPMTLLYGGRDAKDIAYLDELGNWAPELKVKLGLSQQKVPFVSAHPRINWEKCRITQFLEQEPPIKAQYYICGNGGMVKDVQDILLAQGVPKTQIFMERFN